MSKPEMSVRPSAVLLFAAAIFSLAAMPGNEVRWYHGDLDKALADAKSLNKRVLVYFWANPSKQCSRLYTETMKNADCVQRMKDYVCFSADTTGAAGNAVAKKYNVKTLPTVLVLNADGGIEDAILGFCPPKNFNEELDRIARGDRTVSFYRRKAAAAPDDLAVQYELASQLQFVGYTAEYEAICRNIREKDPKGKTLTGAYFIYADLKQRLREEHANVAEADLTPLRAFLKRIDHAAIQWEGYAWIGGLEYERDNRPEALKAFRTAWDHCPTGRVLDFSGQLVASYWKVRADLRTAEKKFLVAVGEAGLKHAKSMEKKGDGDPTKRHYVGSNYPGFLAGRYDALACCYVMAGRRRDAIAAAKKSIELDPKSKVYGERLKMIEGR